LKTQRAIKSRFIRNLKIFFVFALSILLILEFLPSVYSASRSNSIKRNVGDYGVLRDLDILLQEKEDRAKSAQIDNETKARLDQINLIEQPPMEDELDYQIRSFDHVNYDQIEPIIFNGLKKNPIVNNTTILDFLFDRPLNYWIYTKSEGVTKWSPGMLRRTIQSLSRWVNIDVDNNLTNGEELRVRFDIVFDFSSFQIGQVLPLTYTIQGGFGLTIERIVNRSFPLELYIAKSISYEGENYIWTTGINFDRTPIRYNSSIMAETIEFSGLSQKLWDAILAGGLSNLANTTLAEINGPYSLRYKFDSDLKIFEIMAGLVKYENLTLTDKNWLVFHVTPAEDQTYVSRSGEVWVDSSNVQAPIDNLRWTSGIFEQQSKYKIPINLNILYGELRKHLIIADVRLINVPEWFVLNIDYTKVIDGKNVTTLDYSAADVLTSLNYSSYLYPDYYANPETANTSHVLIEDVPASFHMELTSDIGRDINSTPYHNPQVGFAANVLNNMIVRVANRFYRIGKYLKLAAEGVTQLPSSGGKATIDAYSESFGLIEFYQTSGNYVETSGNYIAFFNNSNPIDNPNMSRNNNGNTSTNQSQNATVPQDSTSNQNLQFSISGRLTNLNKANISFSRPLEFELRAMEDEPFKGIFIDGTDYVVASVSNVPGYINIQNYENSSYYSTMDPDNDDAQDGTIIDNFEFISKVQNNLMKLDINKIPAALSFNREESVISFSTDPDGYIEDITFIITNDASEPYYLLTSGDYMFIYQDEEFITASGKLSGIKNLTFDQSENGYFDLYLNKETQMQIMLVNNKGEHTKAKMILDPIPNHLYLELPGVIKTTNIDFPEMTNMTGFVDYSQFVFTLGNLGNELINLLGNMSQNLINSIGNIGFDFSISYELESFGTNMDMIAEIERGGIPNYDSTGGVTGDIYATSTDEVLGNKLGWTHGIVMRQDNYEGNEILRGHLYLQGMPEKATLTTQFTETRTNVELSFVGYNPRHDWLLIELINIQDRDVTVYFQKIPDDSDFFTSADLFTDLKIGGEMSGEIEISLCDSGSDRCSRDLGALYINMHTIKPIQSIREVYFSEMTSKMNIDFALQREMRLDYKASSEIEFIYSKLSKILTSSWHHMDVILHDIPKSFNFNLFSNTDFDIDDPLPLQGMPRLAIETNRTKTLDIILSIDGAAIGQRGNVELNMQNIQDTYGFLEDNWYHIKSEGLDFIRLKLSKLPILDNYRLNNVILEAEDLEALIFKVNLLFGVYPYFELGTESAGKIEITIDHTLTVFGQKLNAQVAIIDIVYESAGGIEIPVATPMFINSINTDITKTQHHVLVPAILVSLLITWTSNI
jgi:hypothetical protein